MESKHQMFHIRVICSAKVSHEISVNIGIKKKIINGNLPIA